MAVTYSADYCVSSEMKDQFDRDGYIVIKYAKPQYNIPTILANSMSRFILPKVAAKPRRAVTSAVVPGARQWNLEALLRRQRRTRSQQPYVPVEPPRERHHGDGRSMRKSRRHHGAGIASVNLSETPYTICRL